MSNKGKPLLGVNHQNYLKISFNLNNLVPIYDINSQDIQFLDVDVKLNGSKKVINILQIQKCMCLCVHDENLFVGSQ